MAPSSKCNEYANDWVALKSAGHDSSGKLKWQILSVSLLEQDRSWYWRRIAIGLRELKHRRLLKRLLWPPWPKMQTIPNWRINPKTLCFLVPSYPGIETIQIALFLYFCSRGLCNQIWRRPLPVFWRPLRPHFRDLIPAIDYFVILWIRNSIDSSIQIIVLVDLLIIILFINTAERGNSNNP